MDVGLSLGMKKRCPGAAWAREARTVKMPQTFKLSFYLVRAMPKLAKL